MTIRRNLLFASLLMLCAVSVSAADSPWRVSILASEMATSASGPWEEAHPGVGVGIAYIVRPQWDVELTASSQTHRSAYTRLFYFPGPDGSVGQIVPAFEYRRYRVTPLDLSVTRHFLAGKAVTPYVRLGVRYVDAPADPVPTTTIASPGLIVQVGEGYGFNDRTSGQAGLGFRVRMTPRTALRVEADRLLRSGETDFDPLTRYAAGVSWQF